MVPSSFICLKRSCAVATADAASQKITEYKMFFVRLVFFVFAFKNLLPWEQVY